MYRTSEQVEKGKGEMKEEERTNVERGECDEEEREEKKKIQKVEVHEERWRRKEEKGRK